VLLADRASRRRISRRSRIAFLLDVITSRTPLPRSRLLSRARLCCNLSSSTVSTRTVFFSLATECCCYRWPLIVDTFSQRMRAVKTPLAITASFCLPMHNVDVPVVLRLVGVRLSLPWRWHSRLSLIPSLIATARTSIAFVTCFHLQTVAHVNGIAQISLVVPIASAALRSWPPGSELHCAPMQLSCSDMSSHVHTSLHC
jgi:hypothetical protein